MSAARSRILFTQVAYNISRTPLISASTALNTTIATAITSRIHHSSLIQTSRLHTTSKMSSSSNTEASASANANTDAYNSNALDAVNQKLLAGNGPDGSKSFPSVTLPGGRTIRTGTVATLLHNISLYNVASAKAKANQSQGAEGAKVDEAEAEAEAEALRKELSTLEHEIGLAIPALREIGMFELFTPENWLADGSGASEGRKCVGRLAKEKGI